MSCCHRKLRRCRRRNERLHEDIRILEELLLVNSGYCFNGLLGANGFGPGPFCNSYPYGAGFGLGYGPGYGLGYGCGNVAPPILL